VVIFFLVVDYNSIMRAFCLLIFTAILVISVHAQTTVSFETKDGSTIFADLYGSGDKGLVLAHGGRFNKESWGKQAQTFATAGFYVLALDFRGYGRSHGPHDADPLSAPLQLDVLASVRYLREHGAKTISIIGGSMGGSAAGDASIDSQPGEIDRVVMLGAAPNGPAEKLKSATLYIVARDDADGDGDRRLPRIREQYEKSPEPKKLVVLDGSAHAQYLFQTDQAETVMREILNFISAKPTPGL
jgi:pimeloyl-ACP methyl ester carboxylesterase